MYINIDEDEYETITTVSKNGVSWTQRRRTFEEVMKIKRERRIKEENEILMKAKIILATRGLKSLDEA